MFSVGGFDGRDSGSLKAATSARCPSITQRVNGPGSGFPRTLTAIEQVIQRFFIDFTKGILMAFNSFFHHGSGIVMTKGIQVVVAAVAMLFAFGGQLQADVVIATFLSTADNSQVGNPYVDNVSFGDTFKIVVTMDNGGSSLVNQTWVQLDVQSVTFEFNNGAHTTVFGPSFDAFIGGFVTDGAGLLISIPEFESANASVISTNSAQTPSAFFVNTFNDLYQTDFGGYSVGLPDASQVLVASNWTIAPAAAVPEPSTIAVFGIGLCAFVVNVARRRRNAKQQGAMV